MNPFAQFISTLLHSRTQAHIFHLQTNSYAEHIALQSYYEGVVPFIDGLVESYQGRMGKLEGYSTPGELREYVDNATTVTYFSGLALFIEKIRQQTPQDSYLQNQIDEVVALVSSTLYKLRMLS
jgi:hypothetical protein